MIMARYTNTVTGVHVSVADEKVLSSDWEPSDDETQKAHKSRAKVDKK